MPNSQQSQLPLDLPTSPCVVSTDVAEQLRQIHATQQEIKTALIGNPALGHQGLVTRVERIEERVEKHDRKLLVWGSLVAAAAVAIEFLKDIFTARSH